MLLMTRNNLTHVKIQTNVEFCTAAEVTHVVGRHATDTDGLLLLGGGHFLHLVEGEGSSGFGCESFINHNFYLFPS